MATTEVPNFRGRPIKVTTEQLRDAMQELLESNQGDSDKAGEVDAACYYDGAVDVLTGLLEWMTTEPEPVIQGKGAEEQKALADIREALESSDVRIALPYTFTHGRCAQVMVKSRKVGPLLIPSRPKQTLADTLALLGLMVEEDRHGE